jgi:Caspase domain/WD domain, G-beta repeat
MPLSVEQLVHTSFSGVGSNTLSSEKMPEAIQQSFMQTIVHPYLQDAALNEPHVRVAYLHQLSTAELFFGWAYTDPSQQNPDELISYFICYYSTQPLDAPQLELIFSCLEKGPATSLDNLERGQVLPPIILTDADDYQSTRPGVPIPSSATALNRLLLYKEKLLHCFVPFKEPQQNPEREATQFYEPDTTSVSEDDRHPEPPTMNLSNKFALLIGVSEHGLGVQTLPGVEKDLESLQQVLVNPRIGNFVNVDIALNPDSPTMATKIEHFLSNCPADSLALLYFSGYGILDRYGTLYLSSNASSRNAQSKIVRSTFVSTDFLKAVMQDCPAKQLVLILDICISKETSLYQTDPNQPIETIRQQLSSPDYTILVSSTAIHDTGVQKGANPSVYTYYLVEGLKTGIADTNHTGIITVGKWHNYAKQKLQIASPALRPTLYGPPEQKQIQVAFAPRNEPKLQYRREVERLSRKGQIDLVHKLILDDLQKSLGLSPAESAQIRAEVLKPYQDYQNKLRQYAMVVLSRVNREGSAQYNNGQQISYLQNLLGLTDVDTEPIKSEIFQQLHTIQTPDNMASTLLLEGNLQSRQLKNLNPPSQVSGTLPLSFAGLVAEANSLTKQLKDRLRNDLKTSLNWSAHQSQFINPGKISIALILGSIGLFIASTTLFNIRQNQERSQTLQTLTNLAQQRKYDDCEKLGKSLSQSLKQANPTLRLLQQCQIGSSWQNAATLPTAELSSAVWTLAFAPKDRTIAIGRDDGKIQLWDIATQQLKLKLKGHSDRVLSLALSPNGTQVASAGNDRTVKLWDVATGNRIHRLKGHQNTVWSVAFAPDGRSVASCSEDGTVKLWNVATGTLLRTFNPKTGAIRAIAIGPDGKTLIAAGANKVITVWDIETGKPTLKLTGHSDRILALSVSENGTMLASGSQDNTIKIWNLQTGDLMRTIATNASGLQTLAFHPDNETIASGVGNAVRLWNIQTGQFIYEYSGSPSSVTATAFSADGQMLAIARENKVLSILKR